MTAGLCNVQCSFLLLLHTECSASQLVGFSDHILPHSLTVRDFFFLIVNIDAAVVIMTL